MNLIDSIFTLMIIGLAITIVVSVMTKKDKK
jgi:cbb3-type cytochrome oxidase subunit 3